METRKAYQLAKEANVPLTPVTPVAAKSAS
jgi:hypothetical protein